MKKIYIHEVLYILSLLFLSIMLCTNYRTLKSDVELYIDLDELEETEHIYE